jgi:hypothetical protein
MIWSVLSSVELGDVDRPVWSSFKKGQYTCDGAWNQVRYKAPTIRWWRIVLFPRAISRHAFICWLALRDSLTTKDRMAKWEIVEICCVLCISQKESRNHLFFECFVSRRVCKDITSLCIQHRQEDDWDKIVEGALEKWRGISLSVVC